jgi:DNA-binding HxlR family transcriptional regulator
MGGRVADRSEHRVPERDVFLADCPARSALELISGTWTVVVLIAMCDDAQRYSELLGRIGGISRKMLTQTLRACARAGLVEPPPRRGGAYRLTPLGDSLMGPLTALTAWAEEHADELAELPRDADPAKPADAADAADPAPTEAAAGTSRFLPAH